MDDNIHIFCPEAEKQFLVYAKGIKIHLEVQRGTQEILNSFIIVKCPKCLMRLQCEIGPNKKLLRWLRDLGAKYLTSKKIVELLAFFSVVEYEVGIDSYNARATEHKIEFNISTKEPLTHDDVIDMHFQMKSIDTVEDFLRAAKGDKKDP